MTILASSATVCPELADTCEIVQCNHCMAVFSETEIAEVDEEEICPRCGKSGGLMDVS